MAQESLSPVRGAEYTTVYPTQADRLLPESDLTFPLSLPHMRRTLLALCLKNPVGGMSSEQERLKVLSFAGALRPYRSSHRKNSLLRTVPARNRLSNVSSKSEYGSIIQPEPHMEARSEWTR